MGYLLIYLPLFLLKNKFEMLTRNAFDENISNQPKLESFPLEPRKALHCSASSQQKKETKQQVKLHFLSQDHLYRPKLLLFPTSGGQNEDEGRGTSRASRLLIGGRHEPDGGCSAGACWPGCWLSIRALPWKRV